MVSARLEPTSTSTSVLLDVGERERQPPVDAERPVARRRRRRHAPAAVVVDLRGAQRDPGELAELVGLLVGQPAAAEDRDRVRAVTTRADRASRSATRSSASSQDAARSSPVARSRTSGVVSRSRLPRSPAARPALAAQRPLVDGELRPRLHLQRATTLRQRHPALERAVGAVGVRSNIRCPAPARLVALTGRLAQVDGVGHERAHDVEAGEHHERALGRRQRVVHPRRAERERDQEAAERADRADDADRGRRLLGRPSQRGCPLGGVRRRSPARPRSGRSPGSSCTSSRCRCRWTAKMQQEEAEEPREPATGCPLAIAGSAVGFGVQLGQRPQHGEREDDHAGEGTEGDPRAAVLVGQPAAERAGQRADAGAEEREVGEEDAGAERRRLRAPRS